MTCRFRSLLAIVERVSFHMWYRRTSALLKSSVSGRSSALYGIVVSSATVGLRSQWPASAGRSGRFQSPRFSKRFVPPGKQARGANSPFTASVRKLQPPSFASGRSTYQNGPSASRFQPVIRTPPERIAVPGLSARTVRPESRASSASGLSCRYVPGLSVTVFAPPAFRAASIARGTVANGAAAVPAAASFPPGATKNSSPASTPTQHAARTTVTTRKFSIRPVLSTTKKHSHANARTARAKSASVCRLGIDSRGIETP